MTPPDRPEQAVERGAAALLKERHPLSTWDGVTSHTRDIYLREVRAVLAAVESVAKSETPRWNSLRWPLKKADRSVASEQRSGGREGGIAARGISGPASPHAGDATSAEGEP